ncbi:MAG: inner-rane translocator [Acidimicrobiales bacterium]|nr:inner-rane translocator [Acidimicrobiales bacterium]
MQDFLAYTVLGLCLGSVYAIAATGLVVTYSTSGVFNFAHGAVATFSALIFWQLRFDWGVPAPIAIFLTIFVFAPAIGVILETVVIRGLRGTSEVTRLVTPIAVLLGVNGAATWIWFRSGSRNIVPKKFFGGSNIKILGQAVFYHQLIGVALAVIIAGALYVLLYRTRTGVTMRATVDDRTLLMLNGGRPDRVSVTSWAIGASLAGLAGVLLSPQQGALQIFALTLLIFDAYPAAIAGRLRSVPLTYIGAMVLGLSKLYFDWISDAGQKWLALRNMRNAIPALLLFAALLLLPQDRLRGAIVTRTRERFHVPSMKQAVAWGGVLVAVIYMLQKLMSGSAVISLADGMALSLLAISLVLLTGYAGEINLAIFTFAGIALIAAWQFDVGPHGLATKTSLSVPAILLAVCVCAIVGGLIALPALRLRGLYLGLATFAFGIVVYQLVFLQTAPLKGNIFGWHFTINLYSTGSLTMPRPHWFGINFNDQRNFLMLMTVTFAVIGIGLIALRRSAYGRMVVAMKDSPAACATLGLNVTRLKLGVFMLSSGISGLGGLMWACQHRTLPNNNGFDGFSSLTLFMIAVVGGIGYVSGALLAGIFLAVLSVVGPNVLNKLGTDYPTLHWLFVSVLGNFTKFVGPALVGIGLGKNPSGIAQQVMDGFRPFKRTPAAAGVWAAGVVGLWFLAWRDVIGNWTFAMILIASAVVVPFIIKAIYADRFHDEELAVHGEALDHIGLGRAFRASDRASLDNALGILSPNPLVSSVSDGGHHVTS